MNAKYIVISMYLILITMHFNYISIVVTMYLNHWDGAQNSYFQRFPDQHFRRSSL